MNAKQRALIAITVLCIDAKITPLHSYLWLLYNLHMTHEAKHKAIWPCLFIFIKWVRRWVIHILYDVSRNYDCEIWRRFMIPYFSVNVVKTLIDINPHFENICSIAADGLLHHLVIPLILLVVNVYGTLAICIQFAWLTRLHQTIKYFLWLLLLIRGKTIR